MKASIILLILTLFAATVNAEISKSMEDCVAKIKSLEWVNDANPNNDALADIAKGKIQFLAIGTFPNIIPAFTVNDSVPIIKSKNYRIIKGTEPPTCSEGHAINIQKAIDYASEYNQKINEAQ